MDITAPLGCEVLVTQNSRGIIVHVNTERGCVLRISQINPNTFKVEDNRLPEPRRITRKRMQDAPDTAAD